MRHLLTPVLRNNILQFYGDLHANLETKQHPDVWQELVTNLDKLKAACPTQNAATQSD